jgi:hypothetical protein
LTPGKGEFVFFSSLTGNKDVLSLVIDKPLLEEDVCFVQKNHWRDNNGFSTDLLMTHTRNLVIQVGGRMEVERTTGPGFANGQDRLKILLPLTTLTISRRCGHVLEEHK